MCSSAFGPANAPSLVTCPIRKTGMCVFFAQNKQLRRHFSHLANAAWRHLEFFAESRLDRVDDHDTRGLSVFRGRENLLDAHLGIYLQIRRRAIAIRLPRSLICCADSSPEA